MPRDSLARASNRAADGFEPNAKLLCADNFRTQRPRSGASSPGGLGFRLGGGGRRLRWPA